MQRKILFIIALTAVILVLACNIKAGDQAPEVRAYLANEVYQVGDVLTLQIYVENNPGLHSIFFDLEYDGAVLEFDSLSEGWMISGESLPGELLYAVSDPVTSDRLGDHLIISYVLQGKGVETYRNGILCEARFRVIAPGEPDFKYRFTYKETAVADGEGRFLAGMSWKESRQFSIYSEAYRSFVLLTHPRDMQVIYENEVAVSAVSSTGWNYYVTYENRTTGDLSDALSARETELPTRFLELNPGYNNIVATLYQETDEKDYILARDRVRVYRPEDDQFIKIISPKPNQLLNMDMVEVIVNSPYQGVTVNGLPAEYYRTGAGDHIQYRARIWLRNGFNTITAEVTGPEDVRYQDTIRVYYQKDNSLFSFVAPRAGEYFKSSGDSYLSIQGEIDSPYKEGMVPNTVTLRVLHKPDYGEISILVDDRPAVIRETTSSLYAQYEFFNDFEIPLANLGAGEIEIIAYKNKEGNQYEDKIHRVVYIDDQRLWIDLIQPNVYTYDLLDTERQIRDFNEGKEPAMNNLEISRDGGMVLPAGLPVVSRELPECTSDLMEDRQGNLFALTNQSGILSVYRKGPADAEWNLMLNRSQMYGYALCATNMGVLVGVSHLRATNESGLYLLQGDNLVNIKLPAPLRDIQFIENRQGRVYLYGNNYHYLYSFDVHTLVKDADGLSVYFLDKTEFRNNYDLKQFVLSEDTCTAILRTATGVIRFYTKTAGGYLPATVVTPEGTDTELTGENIVAGEYRHGDYNAYLLLEDGNFVTSVMEYKKGPRRYFASTVDLIQPNRPDDKIYAAGFQDNVFLLLQAGAGDSTFTLQKGLVFFGEFYPEDDPVVYEFTVCLEQTPVRLFPTSQNHLYLGVGSGLPDYLTSGALFNLHHRLDGESGEISFNYVNDDIEGISGFSFQVDPVWLEMDEAIDFHFAVKEKTGPGTGFADRVIFEEPRRNLRDLLSKPENLFYTIHRRYDPATGREIIYFEFNQIQTGCYLSFGFRLHPAGNSSPAVYNLKIDKKIRARLSAQEGEEFVLPIHGFVYDRTVEEVTINHHRVPLGRDGSFRHNYLINRLGNFIPVRIECTNQAGETTFLEFTVEVVQSENDLGMIRYKQDDEWHNFTVQILNTTEETLLLAGKYYGLEGAVVGYELYEFNYEDGVETEVLVRRGLFTTTQDEEVFQDFEVEQRSADYTAGYFEDQEIRLIPGRQQLRIYTENPGGLREEFTIDGKYPEVNYNMPAAEQRILLGLEELIPPEMKENTPIEYYLELEAFAEDQNPPEQGKPYVFKRSYELSGEIRSLHDFSELTVKSFTPGLVFANGESEQVIPVEAGNRFRFKVDVELSNEQKEQDFYLRVAPNIPALIWLQTGARLTARKCYENTNFIPDFNRIHPDNWTEEEENSLSIPLRVKFNRDDLPVPESWMTLTINHSTILSGRLLPDPEYDSYYLLEQDGEPLKLEGLKYGRNRIRWLLQYVGDRAEYVINSSSRPGMYDYVFDYPEPGTALPTEIWFEPDLTGQYYDEETLPLLNISKDESTVVEVRLNEILVMEDAGENSSLNNISFAGSSPREGRNEILVTCTESLQDPSGRVFTFLYDTRPPEVEIASWQSGADDQTLTELSAVVTEANFAKAYLYYGPDIINRRPEINIIAEDKYLLRWTDLSSLEIKPSVKPVTVEAHDHSGKKGTSPGFTLPETKRPEEETARKVPISLPIYEGDPVLVLENNYLSRPFPEHTKFAPQRFLPRESVIGDIGEDGSFLVSNLFEQKVTAGNGAAEDYFGCSVGIDGDVAIIGAYGENNQTGAAYIYERKNNRWVARSKLTASEGAEGDRFGWSVSISGNTAIVGAYGAYNDNGAAYIYERKNNRWVARSKLTVSNGAEGDRFGWSVSNFGDIAVVGAYGAYNDTGVVYIYERENNQWVERDKLTASDGAKGELFGYAVDIDKDVVIVGAPHHKPGRVNKGAVYIYKRVGISWEEQSKLRNTESDFLTSETRMGLSVAISGGTMIIERETTSLFFIVSKKLHLYEQEGLNWIEKTTLKASGSARLYPGAVSNNMVIFGSLNEKVHIYERDESRWKEQSRLTATDGEIGDCFGNTVAIFEDTAIVGAYKNNNENGVNAGAVYFFQLNPLEELFVPRQKYLVFKVAKDPFVIRSKNDLAGSINFEAVGYKQNISTGVIEEVNPTELNLMRAHYFEGFNHIYYVTELEELKKGFLIAAEELFPGGYVDEGYRVHDWAALRVRFNAPVNEENLVDIYLTGDDHHELEDILFYDPGYEDPTAPTYLHPNLNYNEEEISHTRTDSAEEMTFNFWLRLEDEKLWDVEYTDDAAGRVLTIRNAGGNEIFALDYQGNELFLYSMHDHVYERVWPLDEEWNMVTLRLKKGEPVLEVGVNGLFTRFEGVSLSGIEQALAGGAGYHFGPFPDDNCNTGFFSVAAPFYIDQYLSQREIERLYVLEDKESVAEQAYHFHDALSDFGEEKFQLRLVGGGDDYFTSRENPAPEAMRGYGSLKASSLERNFLGVKTIENNSKIVAFEEADTCLTFNLEVTGGANSFTLLPTGEKGKYIFGNKNSNYGLGRDRWYSLSGTVLNVEPETTAHLVLRIDEREQSLRLQPGRFHYVYDNSELISPSQVQLYIETDGPVTLGTDLALNQGNYIVHRTLEKTAAKTIFPFGLSGTVQFWYKPLNANPDGLVNYETVLFDSELLKIWTSIEDGDDAVFYAGIKNAHGQLLQEIPSGVRVNQSWQHLQVSYTLKEDEKKGLYFYINGDLVGFVEGFELAPFGSLAGEVPATDNAWLGCNSQEEKFAQGYLAGVVLSQYYQREKYQAKKPAVLTHEEEMIFLTLEENMPEADSIRYTLTGMEHSFREEGEGFPLTLNGKPAGRYRLTVDLVIHGRNYREIFFFNLDTRPRFVLQEQTPLIFSGEEMDLRFKFSCDASYRWETEAMQYMGLAARISYDGNKMETRYVVQDFFDQNPSGWLFGVEQEGSLQWEILPPDNAGLLELVFPGVKSGTDIQAEFKYFYFQTGFSEEERFVNLPAVDLAARIPTAVLKQPIIPVKDKDGHEYKLVVDITDGGGGTPDPIFGEIEIVYNTVYDETGVVKTGGVKLINTGSEAGRAMLYYDDILHWNGDEPLYGIYSCRLALKYKGMVYMETEPIMLNWTKKEEEVSSSVVKKLEIEEFSLLHIDQEDPENPAAGFFLKYLACGIERATPKIEIIEGNRVTRIYSDFPELPEYLTSRIFRNIGIPLGRFRVRITLTAGEISRTREIEVNNEVNRPEIVLTNSVDAFIQHNNVLFSWMGYYQGQFNSEIKYQYNLDYRGWTTPNSEWRSVRFYNLEEGYHIFQVRAVYQGMPSDTRQVTFFVDTEKPVFDADKITVQKHYDSQDVFYAVTIKGEAGAVYDVSLRNLYARGETVVFEPDGSFATGLLPITKDGKEEIRLTAYDRVGNYADYTVTVDNRLTEIIFPQPGQNVRYSPVTLVGTIDAGVNAKMDIYVQDTQSTDREDYTDWKKATINADRTFFVEDLFINPGTRERNIVTTLRMVSVFASGRTFEKEIEFSANELTMPIEMDLSVQAVEGEGSDVTVSISCRANVPEISSWSIDFDGDGVYDRVELVDNPGSHKAQQRLWEHRYSTLGIVRPRVRVITTDGHFFSTAGQLIIHEKVREASFKLVPNPIALTNAPQPDGSNHIFILRKNEKSALVEVYLVGRNDNYLSQRLFTIDLGACQIEDPTAVKAAGESLFVAAGREIYQLDPDQFGNYGVTAVTRLTGQAADFVVKSGELLAGIRGSNDLTRIPLAAGVMDENKAETVRVEPVGTMPLGKKISLTTDGYHYFFADHDNQRVIRTSSSLRPLDHFGVPGTGEAEFIRPEIIRYHENRLFISDSGRRDIQVFAGDSSPVCTLSYRDTPGYDNYVEPEFFTDIADLEVIAREEGGRLYYYALVLSRSVGKLSMIRLPQWEELRVRVRNNRIVFIKDGEIHTAKPDGSDLRKELSSDSLPRIQGNLDYPSLSPDGKRLAFTSRIRLYSGDSGPDYEDNIYTYSNLYYMSLDSNDLIRIDLGFLNGYELERPVFNSNGNKLVFSAKTPGGKWNIYTYCLLTSQVTEVITGDENTRFPYFSPDDRFIVFTSDFGGNEEIEIISIENPNVRTKVTANYSRNSLPVWSRVYPGEIDHPDLQRIIKSKIAYVSEKHNYKGIYYVYLAHVSDNVPAVYDLNNRRVAGDNPDTAALEVTAGHMEGDYPCFTGDGRNLIFECYDGQATSLKKMVFETNLDHLFKGEAKTYQDLRLLDDARRPAGMKNMITNFTAENQNGNEIVLNWDRYTDNDIRYTLEYQPVNSDDVCQNFVLGQTGAVLTGLMMGTDYLVRVFIEENDVEVATSYWATVKMPEVVARPSYTIDPDNPYLIKFFAWKPGETEETYKWRFTWDIDHKEYPVQDNQKFSYEFGTSGTKTVSLKAYTEGQTATHTSDPMTVEIISDIRPVIEYNLADDMSSIELSAASSLGKNINYPSTQWVVSGPGREPLTAESSKVELPLDGFQRRVNIRLTLERKAVGGQIDILETTKTVDLEFQGLKPVITYEQPLEEDPRLFRFSGEYSMGNIHWPGVSWNLFADGELIYSIQGATTFDYHFPETNRDKTYTVSLTVPRRNDGITATTSQLVTVAAMPIEAKINYEILELKQGDNTVDVKLMLDCTESIGSGIDYPMARWTVPVASAYGEPVTQVGPTAVFNLTGIGTEEDLLIEVALTLSRKNGADPVTVTRIININKNELPAGKLVVNKNIEEGPEGKVLVLDVLNSTGPNIDWERTEWIIGDEHFTRRGPVARLPLPSKPEETSISFTCLLYRHGATTPERHEGRVEIDKTTIRPVISARRLSGTQHRMYELSVLDTRGVNIDWEQTRWFIYGSGEQTKVLHGSVVAYQFPYHSEQMGYPVLVEMYLKGSSFPFIGYTTIDVEGDDLIPIITTEVDPKRPNVITFSAVSSIGSNIDWSQTQWNFGDTGNPQYGPVVTHEYPLSDARANYRVTLTLSRTTAGGVQEIKTASRDITIGPDQIRAVIKATKYYDSLVLSAEESQGKGLLLDRCNWLFEGRGDTETLSETHQGGTIRRQNFSQTNTFTVTDTKKRWNEKKIGVDGSWFVGQIDTHWGSKDGNFSYQLGYSPEIWEKVDYSDYINENLSFSTQNTHTGAVCRRYVGDDNYLVVTLFVYRMTENGVEGESVTVRINLNDANLTGGAVYGK